MFFIKYTLIILDFFFEAMVTVNLTGMLVLTTIFMTVSSNLPQTSYVKMIDIWLLFCILVPFFEVLLHVWIDSNRTERRNINNHGDIRTVLGDDDVDKIRPEADNVDQDQETEVTESKDIKYDGWTKFGEITKVFPAQESRKPELISRHEDIQVDALRKHYRDVEVREKNIRIGEFLGRRVIPGLVITFMIIYWGYGLSNYGYQ